jgi:hypothetical protein
MTKRRNMIVRAATACTAANFYYGRLLTRSGRSPPGLSPW